MGDGMVHSFCFDHLKPHDVQSVEDVMPSARQFVEGLPDATGTFVGYWNDAGQSYSIEPRSKPRRGGNQHARWWTFDADVTDQDGVRQSVKRVRIGMQRIVIPRDAQGRFSR